MMEYQEIKILPKYLPRLQILNCNNIHNVNALHLDYTVNKTTLEFFLEFIHLIQIQFRCSFQSQSDPNVYYQVVLQYLLSFLVIYYINIHN